MAKLFPVTIVTPEKEFFSGEVYSLSVEGVGGRFSVLAGHIPMVTALSVGTLVLRDENGEHLAFHSEGFMEVLSDRVVVLAQACEWPEEIDERRASEAEKRARQRLDKEKSGDSSHIALMRAIQRLKVASHRARGRDSINH